MRSDYEVRNPYIYPLSNDAYFFFLTAQHNWSDAHPKLSDLPPMWPGTGLDQGLRDEHLTPDFGRLMYKVPTVVVSGL